MSGQWQTHTIEQGKSVMEDFWYDGPGVKWPGQLVIEIHSHFAAALLFHP